MVYQDVYSSKAKTQLKAASIRTGITSYNGRVGRQDCTGPEQQLHDVRRQAPHTPSQPRQVAGNGSFPALDPFMRERNLSQKAPPDLAIRLYWPNLDHIPMP